MSITTHSRRELLTRYTTAKRRIEDARKQILADERAIATLKTQIHDLVSLEGPLAHDHTLFCLDPADRTLLTFRFRSAVDLDAPDPAEVMASELADPLIGAEELAIAEALDRTMGGMGGRLEFVQPNSRPANS